MVDLHVHSDRSDGTLTPKELVDYAIEKGLSAFALTDHDCIDGIDEAFDYAKTLRTLGKENVPEVIPGIELSTESDGVEVHVVGLYIDRHSGDFKRYLKEFVDERENRNRKMCDKFKDIGIDIDYDELRSSFPDAVITRAHFAIWLKDHGYVNQKKEAFERYIGNGKKCYVNRELITPEKAIELILSAGGVPIFAHPILCKLSDKNLDALTGRLKEHGLMGIEAQYSTYKPADERFIRSLADKYHLLLSGGSDFHGTNKDGIDLAVGYGNLYIHNEVLDTIKLKMKNLLFTDLDGTLFKSDSTISENMHAALKRLTANGHIFAISSGRPLPSILERVELLDMHFPNMYIIANNGANIYDLNKHENIFSKKLPSDVIRSICDLCNESDLHVHSYTDEEIIGFEDDKELKFYHKRVHMPFIRTNDIAGYLKDGAYKVQIISLESKKDLEDMRDKILCKLGDKVEAFFSNDRYLEILPKGVSKGAAVIMLTDLLSMSRSNTFAAGDDENDIPMIETAHTGIAMKNASDKVKAAASIVTEKTNEDDGLLDILDKYFN